MIKAVLISAERHSFQNRKAGLRRPNETIAAEEETLEETDPFVKKGSNPWKIGNETRFLLIGYHFWSFIILYQDYV